MTLAEEFRSRNFSKCMTQSSRSEEATDNFGVLGIYGQWSVTRAGNPSFDNRHYTNFHDIHMLRSIYTLKQGLFVGTGQPGMNQHLHHTFEMGNLSADLLISRLGVLSIILCIALGIANLLHLSILILFGALCLLSGLVLIFVEVPLLLRICPTSSTFDNFIRRFTTNAMRAAIYGTMSLIQWLSLIKDATSLIAAAVILLLAALCYAIAALKKQTFVGSKTLGGQGVAQMIV
ncbi:Golgi apparatus membrane protein tvp18 [Sticta canariensis]|nr:Golgi apparatus membrane protein tvp18 [Sticta canariensis]